MYINFSLIEFLQFTVFPDNLFLVVLEKVHAVLLDTRMKPKKYRPAMANTGDRYASPVPGWLPLNLSQNGWGPLCASDTDQISAESCKDHQGVLPETSLRREWCILDTDVFLCFQNYKNRRNSPRCLCRK